MAKKVNKKTAFVALSGGVDSSVAAALLKKQGFDVVGIHMKCYNVDGCAEQDAEDARRAAEVLGIPFYTFDFEQEYKDRVVQYMIDGYRQGITPNPDVMCNKEIKFGLFFKKAIEMGADFVATGHYVRHRMSQILRTSDVQRASDVNLPSARSPKAIGHPMSQYCLYTAKDKNKDQSYFLWTLTQEQLKRCLFPIGEYTKPEVRKLAKKFGLPTAEKKDSQGICFLGQVTLADFLKQYIPEKRGVVVNTSGEKLGEHRGAHLYTIGQRHGLGIAGNKPYYVAAKDIKTNTVVLAEGSEDESLYKKEIELANVNFIRSPRKKMSLRGAKATRQSYINVFARVRYRQPVSPARLYLGNPSTGSGQAPSTGSGFRIVFNDPQKFVASGQSAVFYEYKKHPSTHSGLKMLGGGIIL